MAKVLQKSNIDKNKYKFSSAINDDKIIDFKMIFENSPSTAQIRKLDYILKEFNLKKKYSNNLFVDVKGKASDIKRLFNIDINEYKMEGKKYFSDASPIRIPESLNFISDIIGLNNFPKYKFHSIIRDKEAPGEGFTPIQIAELYDFPMEFRGSNRNIAMIQLGGGYKQSEMRYYFMDYLKLNVMPTIIPIVMDGASNNPEDKPANADVNLDIQICGAVAKCATILVYFAPNNDLGFYDSVYFAITNQNYRPPCALSISWGSAESLYSSSFINSLNKLLEIAVKYRINVFASSGDNGSSDGQPGLNVNFPASSPNAIGCGGTTIFVENDKIVNEVTWHGSGGGYSKIFSRPQYQTILSLRRGVPDVAGNADSKTGYIVFYDGKFHVLGGTGAVASLYSALTALMSQARGSVNFLSPIIYPNAKEVCYDVTEGSNGPNGKWDARKGWDPCTGNGRIYGRKLLEALSATS